MAKDLKEKKFFKQVIQLDAFATSPSLNYRGGSHYTFMGFLLTIFMVLIMVWFSVDQIKRVVQHETMTSFISYNPSAGINYHDLEVCLEQTGAGSGIFTGDWSKYINVIALPTRRAVQINVASQTATKLCVSIAKKLEHLSQHQLLTYVINENEFMSNGLTSVKLTWTIYVTGVIDRQDSPIGRYEVFNTEEFNFAGAHQNIYYTMDENIYFLKTGFLFQETDLYPTLEYVGRSTVPDPRMRVNYDSAQNFAIHFGHSGKYNKTNISKHTLWEMLANIGGLYGSLTLIFAIVFSKFLGYKYSENMLKELRARGYITDVNSRNDGNDSESPLKLFDLTKSPETARVETIVITSKPQVKQETENQVRAKADDEIQISLWAYLIYKSPVGKVLTTCFPKLGANSKQRKQVEILDFWEQEFDSSLDAVNVIGRSINTNGTSRPIDLDKSSPVVVPARSKEV